MSGSDDVSWQTLRRIVRSWAGDSAEIGEVRHLHGGAVSNTLGILLESGAKAVLKISPHRVDRSVMRESRQLEHLRAIGVPVPKVYLARLADLDEPDSYLLMEHIDGVDLATAREQCSAGEYDRLQEEFAGIVVKMHGRTAERYQRVGVEGAEGETFESWPAFFARVYEGMWRELEKDPATTKACKKAFNKVHDALPRLLAHEDKPRLVHWDLWTSNVLVSRNGDGWGVAAILDPMCKYGHAEGELAYLEMFQTVNSAFMKRYKTCLKVSEGYARWRRGVYQLYFTMDHAAFFGGQYHAKLAEAADRVAGEI